MLYPACLKSQTSGLGSWEFFYGKYNFKNQWFALLEPHVQSGHFTRDYHYYEFNAGIGRTLSKTVTLSAAFGKYETYQPEGDFHKPLLGNEFRLWEQVSVTNYISRIKFEQRYRLEQRFIEETGYHNRFRIRLQAVIPINHSTFKPGTIYTNTSNEFFLTNERPFFDQNWLFLGLGYQLTTKFAFHVGWLNRVNQSATYNVVRRNYLQTACFFSLN
jgi:hypothetical protein